MPSPPPVHKPEEVIEATAGTLELHTPPATASVNVVDAAGQRINTPEIGAAKGEGLTVTTADVYAVPQLLVTANEIVLVPAVRPSTMPDVPTAATPGDTLLHMPGPVPVTSVRAVVNAGQTLNVPVIVPAVGTGFTVTTAVAATVPQLFVTV